MEIFIVTLIIKSMKYNEKPHAPKFFICHHCWVESSQHYSIYDKNSLCRFSIHVVFFDLSAVKLTWTNFKQFWTVCRSTKIIQSQQIIIFIKLMIKKKFHYARQSTCFLTDHSSDFFFYLFENKIYAHMNMNDTLYDVWLYHKM